MKTIVKTYLFLIVVIPSMLWLASCSKSNPTNNGGQSYKVKTIHYSNHNGGPETDTLIYDSQGRLIKMGPNNTYSYTSNQVTMTYYNTIDVFTLNSFGNILTDTQGINNIRFSYNGDTLYAFWSNSGVTVELDTLIYSNGDLIFAGYSNNGNQSYTYTNTSDTRDYGQSFLYNWDGIIHSKHLINTENHNPYGGGTSYTHTYTFDGQGRVAKDSMPGSSQTFTYY